MRFVCVPFSSVRSDRGFVPEELIESQSGDSSYLTSRHELKGSERGLEICDVGLEFVKSGCDAGLQLRRVLSRGTVGSNLVECWLRHDCDWSLNELPENRQLSQSFQMVVVVDGMEVVGYTFTHRFLGVRENP